MNIEQKLTQMLQDKCFLPDEAKAVMEQVKAENKDMSADDWQEDVSDCGLPMVAVLWMITERIALKWLKDNGLGNFARFNAIKKQCYSEQISGM